MHPANPARKPRKAAYFGLLLLLVASSLPSLLFCGVELLLALHGHFGWNRTSYRTPPANFWDWLLGVDALLYAMVSRWSLFLTLAATLLLAVSLVRRRWRALAAFALLPYLLIVAADL